MTRINDADDVYRVEDLAAKQSTASARSVDSELIQLI